MKISEVSQKYDISTDTLRYYERVGLIPTVNRTESGIRDFNEIDLEWVEFIKCMRGAGLPIDVLTEYVDLVQAGNHTFEARKQLLIQQRAELVGKMEELQATLDLLNYKISIYDKAVAKKEEDLKKA